MRSRLRSGEQSSPSLSSSGDPAIAYRPKRRFRPVVLLLTLLARFAPELQPRVQKEVIRAWYQFLNAPGRGDEVATMNYGYAPLHEQGAATVEKATGEIVTNEPNADEANRYGLALYHHVVGAVALQDRAVLEVGCGRGGGAAYVYQHFRPCRMIGMDFSEKAVAFARSHYPDAGLGFLTGDAEQLPFPAHAFDRVVNVESSHCYPHFDRFVQEVKRVLRPGGYFLFADFRPQSAVDALRRQLRQAGFAIRREERITANVVRALDLDSARRLALAQRYIPGPLQNIFNDFAGVRGSQAYIEFATARNEYLFFVLQKDNDNACTTGTMD